jgi:hypothetical protein
MVFFKHMESKERTLIKVRRLPFPPAASRVFQTRGFQEKTCSSIVSPLLS